MKEVNEIMNILDNIEYGVLDKNGYNIFDDEKYVETSFSKVYYLLSPSELLEKKHGVCWDQVELERDLFENKNIKYKTYFIYIDDNKQLPSHTFLVFMMNNKFYWFEHSWYSEKGIHEYDNLEILLEDVKNKFIDSRKNEVDINNCIVKLFEYNKPKYGINTDEFYEFINKQKRIF